jgi:5-methyltetrahydrofolate--homocysteine methyltransferase
MLKKSVSAKINNLHSRLKKQILVLDGAMGTMLLKEKLREEDFRGEQFRNHPLALYGMNELLNLTRPEIVKKIHLQYLEAGADIITTNSFNANYLGLKEYGLEEEVFDINFQAGKLARETVESYAEKNSGKTYFIAGTLGPTRKMASVSPDVDEPEYREVTFNELVDFYREQARGLIMGGVDLIIIETVFDTLNAKASLYAVNQIQKELDTELPVMVSGTITEESGRNLSGQTVEAFYNSLQPFSLFSIGLNCSFGADKLRPYLERLAEKSAIYVSAHPNAGLPNEIGEYDQYPEEMAAHIESFFQKGFVNIIGACCGSTPEHIRIIAERAKKYKPRALEYHVKSTKVSGLQSLSIKDNTRLIKIGERTHVSGSKRLAKAISKGSYEEAFRIARKQIEAGAEMLNISVDDPMIDAKQVMPVFLNLLSSEPDIANVPFMIDSSNFEVLESGLKSLQGKSIANSISLKDGEEAFKYKASRIKELGAALVVMAFDEKGQADTFNRKIAICERAYTILTRELEFPPEDIIFDPSVFAVGTGIKEHNQYAADFIRAVEWIKKNLPYAKVSAGISNVSFAFSGNSYLRNIINSVFLHHCENAGLDFAIMNPEKIYDFKNISERLLRRTEDLLFNRHPEATDRLIRAAREYVKKGKDESEEKNWRNYKPEKRVRYALSKGISTYIERDILELKDQYDKPINIIEGPLMEEMDKVGSHFASGKMFLPQVIKSARVMKSAVSTLMPYLKFKGRSGESVSKGKILLATVEGDVHDIGKNILSLVLQSNNFEVVDLGVMVSNDTMIQMIKQEQPDIIGLSGLITPSLEHMEEFIKTLEKNQFEIPLLVGGATTSAVHTALKLAPHYSGAVVYGSDASKGILIANKLLDEDSHIYQQQIKQEQRELRTRYEKRKRTRKYLPLKDARKYRYSYNYKDAKEVVPRLIGNKVFDDFNLKLLRKYIDWTPFFHGWGLKGVFPSILEKERVGKEASRLFEEAQEILDKIVREKLLRPKGIIGLFPANSEGDDILIFTDDSRRKVYKRIPMLRQQQIHNKNGFSLSLSDFIAPVDSGIKDYFGGFAVTSGFETEKYVKKFKEEGDSYNSVMFRLIADRLVESFAEVLHERVRKRYWGYEPREDLSKDELIKEKYKGIRPAPGYPACPDHTLKVHIFDLLKVTEKIGITLTDSLAMNPASSVAGFYMANDLSRYFGIGKIGKDQVADYAERTNIEIDEAEKWLYPVLDYK